MKNLTDFRKTVETGLDPRLAADGIIGVSDIAGCPQDENWAEIFLTKITPVAIRTQILADQSAETE